MEEKYVTRELFEERTKNLSESVGDVRAEVKSMRQEQLDAANGIKRFMMGILASVIAGVVIAIVLQVVLNQ